jgi:inner membrane transporter RhtA
MITIQVGNAIAVNLIQRVGVAGAASLRLIFGAAFLFVLLRPRVRVRSELRLVLTFGLIVAVMSGSIYGALENLPLGIAVTISLLGPLTVSSLHSRRRLDLVWPGTAIIGVTLLANSQFSSGPPVTLAGVGFALLSATAWGSYIVVSARAGEQFDGVEGLALAAVVAAILWLPAGIIVDRGRLIGGATLLWGLLTGVVATGLPYTLENLALRRLPARIFGTLVSLEPAIATIVGLLFLGEAPGLLATGGIFLVTLASFGVSLPTRPNPVSVP